MADKIEGLVPMSDGPAELVSVIIVSYQTRDLIIRCLNRLSSMDSAVTFEIIVVDNASADGSADAIAEQCPQVRLVRLPVNVGFGRAVNAGAAAARSPWLLLLNPDTEPVGDLIGELVGFARAHPGCGIVAGRSLRPDGSDELSASLGAPTVWGYVCFATGLSTLFPRAQWCNPEKLLGRARVKAREVSSFSGCVVLFDNDLFQRLGGFAPRYFMYSEDVDLSTRAWHQFGVRPLFNPDASVLHHGGASSSSSANKRTMVLRGKCTYVRSHWTPVPARIGLALLVTGVALRAAGTALLRRSGGERSWLEVWRRRAVWLPGWPQVSSDQDHSATAVAA